MATVASGVVVVVVASAFGGSGGERRVYSPALAVAVGKWARGR
jgi:hypothetical protein